MEELMQTLIKVIDLYDDSISYITWVVPTTDHKKALEIATKSVSESFPSDLYKLEPILTRRLRD